MGGRERETKKGGKGTLSVATSGKSNHTSQVTCFLPHFSPLALLPSPRKTRDSLVSG